MEEENNGGFFRSLIDLVNDVALISDYRYAVRKQYCNLARRLKLLIPMFEEMRDMKQALPDNTVGALVSLKKAMESTKELLRLGTEGSKIYLVRLLYCLCGICLISVACSALRWFELADFVPIWYFLCLCFGYLFGKADYRLL